MNLIYCRNKKLLFCSFNLRYESLDKLVAIGCDGTNVKSGRVRGTIRLMEEELQKPLQWHVCQLHVNELPLRHLLIHIDGATSGPRAFTGKIGKAMPTCEKLPIVVFTPLEIYRRWLLLISAQIKSNCTAYVVRFRKDSVLCHCRDGIQERSLIRDGWLIRNSF